MRTVNFRLLKRDHHWFIQLKKAFRGWKTHGRRHGANGGSAWIADAYQTKKEALKAVPKVTTTRKKETLFVQHPTIKIF
jgi:hypothetical protein